jgi:hypothetical protein
LAQKPDIIREAQKLLGLGWTPGFERARVYRREEGAITTDEIWQAMKDLLTPPPASPP